MHHKFYLGVTAVWLSLAALFALMSAFDFSPFVAIPGFFLIGWLQYVLVQAMHEAVHQFFLKHGLKSWFAAFLTTYPVGLTRNYLMVHLTHHWNLGDPQKDPDAFGYHLPPRSKLQLVARLAKVGLVFPAFLQFFSQNSTGARSLDARAERLRYRAWSEFASLCMTQAVLVMLFTSVFSFWCYLIFWMLPIVTVVKTLSLARLFAEHSKADGGCVLRSFKTNAIMGSILGPFGFSLHGEHHLQMTVPFDRLREIQIPANDSMFERYNGSHVGYLWNWMHSMPLLEKKGK